jgi:pre-rRNA-processing protein TSR3
LTTAEAIAAALYIAGFKEESKQLLSIFTWGHTFFELNDILLSNYVMAKDSTEIVEMQNKLLKIKRYE